jgi:hypothetical protein
MTDLELLKAETSKRTIEAYARSGLRRPGSKKLSSIKPGRCDARR